MNFTKALEIQLDEEALDRLSNGEALQVPVDERQRVVIYPPAPTEEEGSR